MATPTWRVVGGEDKGGIVVRTGQDLDSTKEEQRLSTGSVVQQEELVKGRLRYTLIAGTGPAAGWVSIVVSGRQLLLPVDQGKDALEQGIPNFQLLDGKSMPALGLGVYRSKPGAETYNAVKWALEAGYRMIDTAAIYNNEESVGKAIRDSGIPRDEIFLTTKLWNSGHGYENALKCCETSLQNLGLDYLDLYLIHSPNGGKLAETWDALLELQRAGRVRSVGVSNFGKKHIEALKSLGRPLPTVNQIEMHPMVYEERKALVDYCVDNLILVQAYGSVFSGHDKEMSSKAVQKVVSAHPGKTPAQILLRWGHDMGLQVIPKSIRKERIHENMNIFDFSLSPGELSTLNEMRGSLGEYWYPMNAPVDLGRTNLWKGA